MSNARFQGVVQNALGAAVPGVEIYVCTQPASTGSIPPAPLASLFANTGSTTLANPVTSDGSGNFFFYAAVGTYTIVYFDPFGRIPTEVFPDQQVGSSGGGGGGGGTGTVTDVALTGDGIIFATSVPGSPVSVSGTFAPALLAAQPNAFLAGPTSGGAATPTYRALVIADLPVIPGSGTVTSVAATGDGVVFNSTISGSPITTSGTLVPALLTQNANKVFAGPTSGGAATPTWRSLVAADLPGGTFGTVTSVAATFSGSGVLTAGVTGSPITTSGTLAFTISIANQSANTFLAGPASGGSGAVTARAITPADLPGQTTVAFSATPTFNALAVNSFKITLTGNVTSSTISNPTAGQTITFLITQDGTGSRTFVWPANVKGGGTILPDANGVSVQGFIWDGANWRATGAMFSTTS